MNDSVKELVGRVLGKVSILSKVSALQSVKPVLDFEELEPPRLGGF